MSTSDKYLTRIITFIRNIPAMVEQAQTPPQETAPYIEWLNKEGYQIETSVPMETDVVTWSRKSKYGAPKCTTNGDLFVFVSKHGDTFSMHLRASTPNYWGSTEIYNIDEKFLIARGRQLEHRLVDAWRELSA